MTVRNIERRYVFQLCDYKINRVIVRHNPDLSLIHIFGDVGYHELSTYHLRAGTGSLHEPITSCKIPTLAEAIQYLGEMCIRDRVPDVLSIIGYVIIIAMAAAMFFLNRKSAKSA